MRRCRKHNGGRYRIITKKLAAAIDKAERTIKTRTVARQGKGYLHRANGKRSGHWEVLVDLS